MSPGRPNAHPGRNPSPKPDQFAHLYPKITSLSRATRSRPCPIQPHTRPTSSPRLRNFFPPIRPNPAISPSLLKHTHSRATLAYARVSLVGALWQLRHPSSSVTRCHVCVPKYPLRQYRFVQVRRQPQLGAAQNVAETNRFRLPANPVPVEACPELAEWAGSRNNGAGAPSNLKQALRPPMP